MTSIKGQSSKFVFRSVYQTGSPLHKAVSKKCLPVSKVWWLLRYCRYWNLVDFCCHLLTGQLLFAGFRFQQFHWSESNCNYLWWQCWMEYYVAK